MSWFKKKDKHPYTGEPIEAEPTYYIDTPVEVRKEYRTFTETDDSGAKIEKTDNERLIYTARTVVNGTEVVAETSRYVGWDDDGYYNIFYSESAILEILQRSLHCRVEKVKKLQVDLPLGTWLPVNWSNPNKDNG